MVAFQETSLFEEFSRDASTRNKDPYNRAFSEAWVQALTTDSNLADWYVDCVDFRAAFRPFSDSHAAGMTQKLLQWSLIESPDITDYPIGYDTPAAWQPVIDELASSEELREDFDGRLNAFDPVTSVPERYIGTLIASSLLQSERHHDGDISVLDIGCSRNHGLGWLHARANPKAIWELNRPYPYLRQSSPTTQMQLNRLILPFATQYGAMYGVDQWPIQDELMRRWFRVCRNPAEFLDPKIDAQQTMLESYLEQPDVDIEFVHANFATPDLGDIPATDHTAGLDADAKFDVITSCTMKYLLKPDERRHVTDNAMNHLADGGIYVETGFCYVDQTANGDHPADQLVYLNDWRNPFSFETHVLRKGSEEFETILACDNGRCNTIEPRGILAAYLAAN